MSFPTIAQAASALAAGNVTAGQLVEEALDRIADPGGEGGRARPLRRARQRAREGPL